MFDGVKLKDFPSRSSPDMRKTIDTMIVKLKDHFNRIIGFLPRIENIDIPIAPTDPEPTGATPVTIDLSGDGAPINSRGCVITWDTNVANGVYLYTRTDGATSQLFGNTIAGAVNVSSGIVMFIEGTRSFEALCSGAMGAVTKNEIKVKACVY